MITPVEKVEFVKTENMKRHIKKGKSTRKKFSLLIEETQDGEKENQLNPSELSTRNFISMEMKRIEQETNPEKVIDSYLYEERKLHINVIA